ncbi:MAG TPA: PIN domain-containing protein [Blastocatellia bacterium]|jgi:predicted nucleic acid-binding protein|nr:PIN domain-containing protein [Blastocatellia bacterium]
MIVCVESNFILELAFLREEHERCEALIDLAGSGSIDLVLPAFSIGEPYEAWVRRNRQRRDLHAKLISEIRELSRSKPYQESPTRFSELTSFLIDSGDDEKQRLDNAMDKMLGAAQVIPIGRDTVRAAINYQNTLTLSPQDSIVYASIIAHLAQTDRDSAAFVTKNSKDFANPDIKAELASYGCILFSTFARCLSYVRGIIAGN